jgi:hypothetical protein
VEQRLEENEEYHFTQQGMTCATVLQPSNAIKRKKKGVGRNGFGEVII